MWPHVCFGSLADISERIRDVRFTPRSRHAHRRHQCLLSAISGHRIRLRRKGIETGSAPSKQLGPGFSVVSLCAHLAVAAYNFAKRLKTPPHEYACKICTENPDASGSTHPSQASHKCEKSRTSSVLAARCEDDTGESAA